MCDQSGFYSNCVTDADCRNIATVNDGLPEADAMWPFAVRDASRHDVLPVYRPCCSFFKEHCNGASCAGGRDQNSCPLEQALQNQFCREKDCWIVGDAVRPSASVILVLVGSLLSLVSGRLT